MRTRKRVVNTSVDAGRTSARATESDKAEKTWDRLQPVALYLDRLKPVGEQKFAFRRAKAAAYFMVLFSVTAFAQAPGRAPAEWVTGGSDAQRTHWIANDPKISVEGFAKPGFQFLWKRKLASAGGFTEAALMDRYIGYRGFRSLAFVAGAEGVAAIDTDLNRLEWEKKWTGGSAACGSASITRSTLPGYPPIYGAGRSAFARSDVGAANEGAVTIAAAMRAAATPAPPRPPDRGPRPDFIYSVGADGKLHAMYLSNGDEPEAAIDFLPASAMPTGLTIFSHSIAYAATRACDGADAGVWALELTTNQLMHWGPASGNIAGSEGMAFGPDGSVYVATTRGELARLDGRSLAPHDAYNASAELVTSPLVFPYRLRTMIMVGDRAGQIHVVDGLRMTAETKSEPVGALTRGALASWQSTDGTRWVAATTDRGITAWRLRERASALTMERAWTSNEIVSPLTPMIINGVVLALSGGKSPAVLYAIDGSTGKPLWDSGKAIAAAAGGGLSGESSQIYFSTNDGTIYAFGYPIEH